MCYTIAAATSRRNTNEGSKMATRKFNTGDRVEWRGGDQAGDKGTVSRTFERDGVPYFDVTWDDDGEIIDYMDWPGTSCHKL
jgi:hypothetical protein